MMTKLGDKDKVRSILQCLRNESEDVDAEVAFLFMQSQRGVSEGDTVTWQEFRIWMKPLILGVLLSISMVLTGINVVIFYSTTIFFFAGVKESILATASVDAVNVFFTIFAAYYIDIVGRKTLLIVGTVIEVIGLAAMSSVLFWGDPIGSLNQGIISVVAVLIFVMGYAIGSGSVLWTGTIF